MYAAIVKGWVCVTRFTYRAENYVCGLLQEMLRSYETLRIGVADVVMCPSHRTRI